jgi:hypothetical protein
MPIGLVEGDGVFVEQKLKSALAIKQQIALRITAFMSGKEILFLRDGCEILRRNPSDAL